MLWAENSARYQPENIHRRAEDLLVAGGWEGHSGQKYIKKFPKKRQKGARRYLEVRQPERQ